MKFQRMKDLREDSDLTQKQIGDIIHVSQRAYSYYEKGNRNVPVEALIRMADYYNISLDYLVGRSDEKKWIKPKQKK